MSNNLVETKKQALALSDISNEYLLKYYQKEDATAKKAAKKAADFKAELLRRTQESEGQILSIGNYDVCYLESPRRTLDGPAVKKFFKVHELDIAEYEKVSTSISLKIKEKVQLSFDELSADDQAELEANAAGGWDGNPNTKVD